MSYNNGIADFAMMNAIGFADWIQENCITVVDNDSKYKWQLFGDRERVYTSKEIYKEYLKTLENAEENNDN